MGCFVFTASFICSMVVAGVLMYSFFRVAMREKAGKRSLVFHDCRVSIKKRWRTLVDPDSAFFVGVVAL